MKVLLAIDASEASQKVIDEVLARPWPKDTSFCVLHVVDLSGTYRVPAMIELDKRAGWEIVRKAAEKIGRTGHETSSDVLLGPPRRTIAEYAKEWKANFILVGSHGQGMLSRLLLGSVAQGVVRAAHCSVEIVRPSRLHGAEAAPAMKILLATDGSASSSVAAESIAKRSWPAGTEVRVISVVQLLTPENQLTIGSPSSVYPASLLEEVLTESNVHSQDAVTKAQKMIVAAGLKVADGEATPLGDPRVVIIEQAKKWGSDLIVLGSHGWRGVDRVLMGSVSEYVAIHAPCSVEIIRA
jgi:nucleotide-binding universal stress UspA family protein